MAEGLNRVMLLGNLGADPELRVTPGGQAVLKLRIATNETYLDRNNVRQERTEWHRVTIWGRRAEALVEAEGRRSEAEARENAQRKREAAAEAQELARLELQRREAAVRQAAADRAARERKQAMIRTSAERADRERPAADVREATEPAKRARPAAEARVQAGPARACLLGGGKRTWAQGCVLARGVGGSSAVACGRHMPPEARVKAFAEAIGVLPSHMSSRFAELDANARILVLVFLQDCLGEPGPSTLLQCTVGNA